MSFALREQFQTTEIRYSFLKEKILKNYTTYDFFSSEKELLTVFSNLEAIRNESLKYYNEFRTYRKKEKIKGKNQMSKKDYKYLSELQRKIM